MMFSERLLKKINENNSVLVVGLDPNLNLFPDCWLENIKDDEGKAKTILEYNKMIIDAIYDQVVAVKPQLAYYEVFGSKGIKALEETIAYAKEKGLFVILDAKRGDIGSTCEAYAQAYLGDTTVSADAVTVNPYLGKDSILPFIKIASRYDKGLFVLTKTSNPSSSDIQDLKTDDNCFLYEKVASIINSLIDKNQTYSNVGAVVGATYPSDAVKIRKILPNSFFLVPGYGAQGATGKDLSNYFDNNGFGALISASRSITYPYLSKNIDKSTINKEELKKMIVSTVAESNMDINKFRKGSK